MIGGQDSYKFYFKPPGWWRKNFICRFEWCAGRIDLDGWQCITCGKELPWNEEVGNYPTPNFDRPDQTTGAAGSTTGATTTGAGAAGVPATMAAARASAES